MLVAALCFFLGTDTHTTAISFIKWKPHLYSQKPMQAVRKWDKPQCGEASCGWHTENLHKLKLHHLEIDPSLRLTSIYQQFCPAKDAKRGSELQLKVVPNPAHQIQVSCDSACRGNLHCWPMPGAHQFDHVGSTDLPVVYCPSKYVWIACFCWRAYESWRLRYEFWLCRFSR